MEDTLDPRDESATREEYEDCLVELVRTYDLKGIRNKQENSAMWDIITHAYNKATGDDYTKKQLQDRTRNIHYKRKKRRKMLKGVQQPQIEEADNYFDDDNNAPDVFMNNDEDAEEIEDKKSDVVQATSVSQSEYESQRIKAEKAREAAEIMYAKAEEARMKRIELETRVQEARLKRENLLAEIASIDAQHRRLN